MTSGRRRPLRTLTICVLSLLLLIDLVALILPGCIAGRRTVQLQARASPDIAPAPNARRTLSVMTLNLAHGRGNRSTRLHQTESAVRANLSAVAALLRRERPDVVALQEADGPSFWSANLDHVEILADEAEFPWHMRGEHVSGAQLHYGAAMLSMLPVRDAASVTFSPSPPTFPKGFVVCAVDWPGRPGVAVDVVSVHLDFAQASAREAQAEEMAGWLSDRGRPLVVMGDFNCRWDGGGGALHIVCEKLGLRPYRPESEDLGTFISSGARLDWILISSELEFVSYRVLPDIVSDHHGVICELEPATTANDERR